jgi:hypothetical protein
MAIGKAIARRGIKKQYYLETFIALKAGKTVSWTTRPNSSWNSLAAE